MIAEHGSGKDIGGREGFQRALDRLDAGEAEGLLVLKIDRFSRSVADGVELLEEYFGPNSQRGLGLFSVQDHIDTTTAAGRLMLTIMLAFGQYERELAGERTQAALKFKRMAKSERCSRFIPYGFRLADDGKTLIEAPEQQAIIALIHELHEGGENYSAIARSLNERKIPTARGKAWHREGVARIINPDARLGRKRRRKKRAG